MNFEMIKLPTEWRVMPIHDAYAFTKKPRGLSIRDDDEIPFLPMESVPIGRMRGGDFELRVGSSLGSGTYIENGDLIVAKITPSFENGKQAIIEWDAPFGFATTEVIPIQEKLGFSKKEFLFHVLLHPSVRSELAGKMDGTTGRRRLSKDALGSFFIPLPPFAEQQEIASLLSFVQRAVAQQNQLIQLTSELKTALVRKLFTEGLRNEPQAEMEIGLLPESWTATPLGDCCDVLSGSLSYTDFLTLPPTDGDSGVECMAVKVSDMNLTGNENKFFSANAKKRLPLALAQKKLIPPNSVVFPKRGAAIATNKKRMTTTWTVLDPNLIAGAPKKHG
jgi:type I restriction enzyme S subunit